MATLVLKSNSYMDIQEIPIRGYWDHSRSSNQVATGDQVLIIPKKDQLIQIPYACQAAVVGVLLQQHDEEIDQEWTSNIQEGSNVRYRSRFDLQPETIRGLTRMEVEGILARIGSGFRDQQHFPDLFI